VPVILHKAKTVGLVSGAAPYAEFSAVAAEHKKALKDQIDRHTAVAMLGITIRTLQRWHHENYGPKRRRSLRGRICYSRAEIEAWLGEHGRGGHRPRAPSKAASSSSLATSLV
jgi:hypothetical protein